VEFRGLEALRSFLAQGPNRCRRMAEAMVRSLALKVLREARRRAPVRTGRLRASISAQPERRLAANEAAWRVQASAPYAGYVEYGAGRSRPRPFLGPSVLLARQELRARWARRFWREVVG
jgi:HK97 gp10 family phage protein